jgi:hypothetical protein
MPAAAAFISARPAADLSTDKDLAILNRHFSRMSTPTPRDRQNGDGTGISRESRRLPACEGRWSALWDFQYLIVGLP